MNEPQTNGEAKGPNPLGQAIARHASLLLRSSQMPNGQLQINPAQLYCDLELTQVRVECLFEVLCELMTIDPKYLVDKLREKLDAESDEMQAELDKPQLMVANGPVARNG